MEAALLQERAKAERAVHQLRLLAEQQAQQREDDNWGSEKLFQVRMQTVRVKAETAAAAREEELEGLKLECRQQQECAALSGSESVRLRSELQEANRQREHAQTMLATARSSGTSSTEEMERLHAEKLARRDASHAFAIRFQSRTGVAQLQSATDKHKRELATRESDCGSAREGGSLGFFGRGKMQKPFEAASFDLEVGALSGIVDTDSGVHIILRLA